MKYVTESHGRPCDIKLTHRLPLDTTFCRRSSQPITEETKPNTTKPDKNQ